MDRSTLFRDLVESFRRDHPESQRFHQAALLNQVGGGSHNLRLFQPFPFYDARCSGSLITDIDGNSYVDFWQGHFGNILGHNPPVVIQALRESFERGEGLATGFPGLYQHKLADLICGRIGADRIRFTTSGTLATMYAIMLARSFTGRDSVLKIGGGWHGSQPFALKGITAYNGGLDSMESSGLSQAADAQTLTCRFNSIEDLEQKFKQHGPSIACLIMEPFIGAGGFIFGSREYIHAAREITQKAGAVLIFDEVVSGFRFHAGALHSLYGVTPDLTVFGKAIGGGMPVSALAGRADLMELCRSDAPPARRVKCEGGTFSAHPAGMLAGYTFLKHLIENEDRIYPRIGKMGALVRRRAERIFRENGFKVRSTGDGGDVAPQSSIIGIHFLKRDVDRISSPEDVWNPEASDVELRESAFKLAMLKRGFHVFHGFGTISHAHTEKEISEALDAIEGIARDWRSYRLTSISE